MVKKVTGAFSGYFSSNIESRYWILTLGALGATQLEQVSEASGQKASAMLGATEGGIVVPYALYLVTFLSCQVYKKVSSGAQKSALEVTSFL